MARTLRHSEGQIGTVTANFVIVGEGVAGCTLAYELAGRGARVAVFERGRIGGEAAKAAAGILSPLLESVGAGPFLDPALDSIARFPALARALRADLLVGATPHPLPVHFSPDRFAAAGGARNGTGRAGPVETVRAVDSADGPRSRPLGAARGRR